MILTNDFRDDAFGAQYQSILWSILYAEENGHTFCYSPIRHINTQEKDQKKYIEDCETLMNIQNKYPNVFTKYTKSNEIVYALRAPIFFTEIEKNLDKYHESATFQKLQSYYFENKSNPFDEEHIHVAIHIRKALPFDNGDAAYRSDTYYINNILLVQKLFQNPPKPLLFHIYSTGNLEDFEIYRSFPVELHINEPVRDTFIGMTFAHVLITARSSLSYTAGLLSKGCIIYNQFWHPPRKHWLVSLLNGA
jgi:hypothetical protein